MKTNLLVALVLATFLFGCSSTPKQVESMSAESIQCAPQEKVEVLMLAQRSDPNCFGWCASDQGMCMGSCQGNNQCIMQCQQQYSRCVSRC
jgi:hypothetical protein